MGIAAIVERLWLAGRVLSNPSERVRRGLALLLSGGPVTVRDPSSQAVASPQKGTGGLPLFEGFLIMDTAATKGRLAPFSLKDAPALIERVFPAQKVGVEAQKERKAGAGQTLTALGSYWKGRKPLVLVRATVLACLLPLPGFIPRRSRDIRDADADGSRWPSASRT